MLKPNKPRILIITPFFFPNIGGVETHLNKLTDFLSSHNFPTTVLTYKPLSIVVNYLKHENHPNLTIHRYWWYGLGLFDKTTPYPLFQFLYIVPGLFFNSLSYCLKQQNKFDVIHAHGFAAAFITRIIKLFLPQKTSVVSTHFIYHRLNPNSIYTKIFKWTFSGFDTILAVSHQSKKELISIGLPASKIKVFRYWINQKEFVPKNKTTARRLLNIPQKSLVFFYFGRFVKTKGIFNLLKVAQKLPQNVLFLLAGDGPDAKTLITQSLSVSNFKILGRLNHPQIINYLAASDFVILPNLVEEAFPNQIIEGLSCGRPVITGNKGSVTEMYNDKIGISLNPTVKNLQKTIKWLINHPNQIKTMSKTTKAFAIEHFSDKNAKVIINSYNRD
ncbi:MAG: glycosyltransferase family 4 protein [Candidatus Shapirobacteria bacterium]